MNEFLTKLNKNTSFIAFRGMFIGALVAQVQSAYDAGHLYDLSPKAIVHMVVGAALLSAASLWHLYIPSPKVQTTSTASSEPSQAKTQVSK